jgi:hypothetical protein
MKQLSLLAICMVFVFASKAQSNADEVALVQSAFGMGKKELITEHMKITDAESATFWKLYDEYEAARKEIGKKRIDNISAYAKAYATLTDEDATKLINASLSIREEGTKLWKSTFKKMSKAPLSPTRAAQFIQVEMYLENMVRNQLSAEIPLIGEFEKK